MAVPSLSWMRSEGELGFLGTLISCTPGCTAGHRPGALESVGTSDSAFQGGVWICPEQDAEWGQRFCADFVIFLRMLVVTHRGEERVTPWGNWEDLCWVSRKPSVSIRSSLILTLQRQEAGLEIEPDSEFRETLRSDFSS